MENGFEDIKRTYHFDKQTLPQEKHRLLFFWEVSEVTRNEAKLIHGTTQQRIAVTQGILQTLDKELSDSVNLSGIERARLPQILAFSGLQINNSETVPFNLVNKVNDTIGSLDYTFPRWVADPEVSFLHSTGGVHLTLLGSAIKTSAQYNALQLGLRTNY